MMLEVGAKFTAIQVQRTIDFIGDEKSTYEKLTPLVEQIDMRLRDELTSSCMLALDPKDIEFFEPKAPLFGLDYSKKFGTSGAFELDEAAKCLALGRPTAAVFHLMRLMEIGIRATARCLGIPDPLKPAERNWGHILKEVWAGIEKKWPSTADRMHGDGALFEGLHASLDAVKNPWRNAT